MYFCKHMISFLKNIISTTLALILTIIILISVIVFFSNSTLNDKKTSAIKENSILVINFSETKIVERKSENPFENLNPSSSDQKSMELKKILDNIEKAKDDKNIKAIYLNSPITSGGISQIEEIRNKLLEFKQTGKKIISYAEVYSQSAYYLASIANKIFLNPQGGIELKGFSASIMFYKDLFDKLDIDVQIIRHGKFKSAVEPFMLNKMSVENREQIKLLLNSFSNNLMDSIANQRNISLQTVQNHADNLSLNSAKDCHKLKYVDELFYQDQVEKILLEICGNEKLNTISLNKYSKVASENKKKISKNKIAIIYATGAINSGKGDENSIGSATTVRAIRKAAKDKNVKGIVFRVNSGGGSALASDVILREVILAKKEKPFVVSLGDYAASGGYYIACAADSIVANPTTLTGSIGVFGMIPNLKNFYRNKLGINIDTVNTNKYSDIGINRRLSEFERNKIQTQIEDIYDTFITRVSDGRSIDKSEVDKIGQGRVWSGYDAKKIGLVDVYGGLETAINITASIAEIKDYRIISLPKKQDPIEKFFNDIDQKSQIKKYVLEKLGANSSLVPIELLIEDDRIQARIPYNIKFK